MAQQIKQQITSLIALEHVTSLEMIRVEFVKLSENQLQEIVTMIVLVQL